MHFHSLLQCAVGVLPKPSLPTLSALLRLAASIVLYRSCASLARSLCPWYCLTRYRLPASNTSAPLLPLRPAVSARPWLRSPPSEHTLTASLTMDCTGRNCIADFEALYAANLHPQLAVSDPMMIRLTLRASWPSDALRLLRSQARAVKKLPV